VEALMVLVKSELIAQLQKEIDILVHLASKIDRSKLDYRPTPKQRSTLELLRYLSIMGPALVQGAKTQFDVAAWQAANKAAETRDFDQTMAVIAGQKDIYAKELAPWTDADFRSEMTGFDGSKISRGLFIVDLVLGGHAAYRTQLFCYLKACGRDDLGTVNLWRGVDAPPPS
jgi:hypothetical protein